MSDCRHLARLPAYLDGTLPEEEAADFEEEIADCPDCACILSELTAKSPGPARWPRPGARVTPAVTPDEEHLLSRLQRALPGLPDTSLAKTVRFPRGEGRGETSDLRFPFRVGPYEVLRRVGAGGMGVVYEAHDPRLGRPIALKMLNVVAGPWNLGERLRREAEVLASLSHPHIVAVHEVGEHEGRPYLVLEFVAGGTLAESTQATPQPPREAAALARTLADAVQFAHDRGVIHRDLKPSNVLLIADCRLPIADGSDKSAICNLKSAIPKIADFGLARRDVDASLLTGTGQPLGTPGYMAPEQAAGSKDVGPAADVYGLGAILYELLTGRPPFQSDSVALTLRLVQETEPVALRSLQPGVPRDLETICLKCLEKEPARRYGSARALGDDLGRFLDGRPIAARPVGAAGRSWRWVKRHRGFALLGGLAVVLLLALAGGGGAYALTEARLRREVEDQQARVEAARTRAMERFRQVIDTFDKTSSSWAVHEGQPELRRANFRALIELCEAYLDHLPDGTPQQPHDVYVLFRLAWMHGSLNEHDVGERLYGEALTAVERLRPSYPEDEELRGIYFKSHLNRCYIRGNAGRWREAADDAAIAHAFARERLAQDPGHWGKLHDFLGAAHNLFLCLHESGQKEESLACMREIIATRRRLAPPRPESPVDNRELANRLTRLGEVLDDIGRPAEAVAPLGEAIELLLPLARDSRPGPEVKKDLESALRLRARVFERLGRHAEAEADRKLLPPEKGKP